MKTKTNVKIETIKICLQVELRYVKHIFSVNISNIFTDNSILRFKMPQVKMADMRAPQNIWIPPGG